MKGEILAVGFMLMFMLFSLPYVFRKDKTLFTILASLSSFILVICMLSARDVAYNLEIFVCLWLPYVLMPFVHTEYTLLWFALFFTQQAFAFGAGGGSGLGAFYYRYYGGFHILVMDFVLLAVCRMLITWKPRIKVTCPVLFWLGISVFLAAIIFANTAISVENYALAGGILGAFTVIYALCVYLRLRSGELKDSQ